MIFETHPMTQHNITALAAIVFALAASNFGVRGQETSAEELRAQIQDLQRRVEELERDVPHRTSEEPGKSGEIEQKGQPLPEEHHFEVFWKDGSASLLQFRTSDKAFEASIGGRIFVDFGFFHEDRSVERQIEDIDEYAALRSVRLKMSGALHKSLVFCADLEFSDQVSLKDVYVGLKDMALNGKAQIGHFREPFGLESLIGRNPGSFLELSSPFVFGPDRNLGAAFFGLCAEERISFAAGVFREVQDNLPKIHDSGGYSFTARFTGLPFFEDGERLLHIGVSGSFRNPAGDEVRYRARPENSSAPYFADTGIMKDVEDVYLLGMEAAFLWDSFSVQGEWLHSWVRPEGGNPSFQETQHFSGFYVCASYFPTGERRSYDKARAIFSGIAPVPNVFLQDGGFGAVEILIRYSSLDLNDDIRGRRMDGITAGLNWHLSPNLRCMFNYTYSELNSLAGSERTESHLLGFRVQMNF